MALGTEAGLDPDDIVLDGDPAPPPQFSAHVYSGQTDGWIKMALGTEVGCGPDHIVLDGNPAPLPRKGAEPPIFGRFLLRPNGCIKMPLGMEVCVAGSQEENNTCSAPATDPGQNPACNADGTCADPNAQCIRANCVCKLGFFYRNSVCVPELQLNSRCSLGDVCADVNAACRTFTCLCKRSDNCV